MSCRCDQPWIHHWAAQFGCARNLRLSSPRRPRTPLDRAHHHL